jgi:hypothetical protein
MKNSKIISIFYLGFLVLALCVPGMAKKKKVEVVESLWAPALVKIDGWNTEWDEGALNSEGKVALDYAFMNDAKNLYILFIFKNPRFLSTIDLTGMKMFFSPEGKKEEDRGIRFVARKFSADGYIALMEKEIGPAPEDKKKTIRTNPAYIIFGHEMISKGKPGEYKMTGALFRSRRDKKTFIYEFSIPFKKLLELAPEIGAEPGKSMDVDFKWGGTTEEINRALASRIGDGAASAAGGAAAAGGLTSERRTEGAYLGGVENSGSRLEQMRRMQPKKYSFQVSVKLAESK